MLDKIMWETKEAFHSIIFLSVRIIHFVSISEIHGTGYGRVAQSLLG